MMVLPRLRTLASVDFLFCETIDSDGLYCLVGCCWRCHDWFGGGVAGGVGVFEVRIGWLLMRQPFCCVGKVVCCVS